MVKQGKDWKSFDGREVEAGQVLVPQMVTKEYARSIGAVMENLRTWVTAGVRYLVMFVQVPVDQVDIAWKVFWSNVNEYVDEKLGPGRRGRRVVSLDAMLDEGYLPEGAAPAAESIVMEGILLDELIAGVEKMHPLFKDVIRLGYQGLERKEIADALPVKKSQAYEVIKRCREEAEKWLR